VAGIPVSRNAQAGAIIKEKAFQWEYETDRGLIWINRFDAEKSLTTSQDINGTQFESTAEGDISGAGLGIEHLLTNKIGVAAILMKTDIDDDSVGNYRVNDLMVNANREETSLKLRYHQLFSSRYRFELETVHRDMDFRDKRANEELTVINAALNYQMADKSGEINLSVENLLDESFNWVTDSLVIRGTDPARKWTLSFLVNF